MEPEFKKGDIVQFGRGTIPYKVLWVGTNGRNWTYDLICIGGLRKGFRYQAVLERKLFTYQAPERKAS
jgi:hypothetical protein